MAYINTQTMQYPVSEQDIRNAYPNTSFTNPFIPPENYVWVFPTPRPHIDNPITQFAREVAPVITNAGWAQRWEIAPIFFEYVDNDGNLHTVEEQETEAIARDESDKKLSNKQLAEQLLLASDWYENRSVSDTTLPVYLQNINEIIDYRVKLRIIATNPTVHVEWPQKPDSIWITNSIG